jgi:ketosteroid isomerase-like protein
MNEESNTKIVQKMYADFGAGDIASVLNAMTPDVIWKQPPVGPEPFAGTVHGREQLGEWFARLDAVSDVEAFEPKEFFSWGDRVVVLGYYRYRSKSTGKLWESDWAMVWTVRDGKLAKGQILEDTLVQAAALRGRNRSRIEQAIDQWNNGDLDAYLELYDQNAKVHHIPSDLPPGITGIRIFYQGLWTALSDIKIKIDDLFEEGDKVALRYTLTAIHNESGNQIVSPGITTLHFSNGRCVERWDAEE